MSRRRRRADRATLLQTPRPEVLLEDVLVQSPVLSIPRPVPDLRALAQARSLIRSLEDRRTFHPMRERRPFASLTREARRMRVAPGKASGIYPSPRLSFFDGKQVSRCVRRKERREVMFALRRTGKGARARRRRDDFSNIGC